MVPVNNLAFYLGEDITLNFTIDPIEDVTIWTITLTIKKADGTVALMVTPAAIDNGPAGQFHFVLTNAQTTALGVGAWTHDATRVNPGQHAVVSIGTLTILAVKPTSQQAAMSPVR